MGSLDARLLRVSLEVDGQFNVYENLWLSVSGTKFANPLQNECEVKIANLAKESRDYLLTQLSPFNKNRKARRVKIEAGRVSTGYFTLFTGDVIDCTQSQPPDLILTLKSKTKQEDKAKIVTKSLGAKTDLSRIARDAADTLGLSLVYEAAEKKIANYSFTGAATKEVEKLAAAGGVDVYVDDSKLVVKNKGKALNGTRFALSEKTGLIGVPELTEQGVKLTVFLNPSITLGARIELESSLNPAASGSYVVYKLSFEAANRDVPFYYVLECERL